MTWFRRPKPDDREKRANAAITAADISIVEADEQSEVADTQHVKALGLVKTLHQIRERNHFGESLEGIYREKRT